MLRTNEEQTATQMPAPSSQTAVVLSQEIRIVLAAWFAVLCIALILATLKGVPSPLPALFHEVVDNVNRNWYWVGAVLLPILLQLPVRRSRRKTATGHCGSHRRIGLRLRGFADV